jgi:adenylate kinase family enzyme
MELEEQLRSRLGVVILGQSGSGKSTLWKVLKEARKLCDNNCHTKVITINPKAITRTQLLGYVDEETREWHDGVLTSKSREIARDETQTQFWLIFDGDIDPDWIEALNSVLDDNKVLTLPSGERIDFDQKKCNLIFETTSLKFASPATISRLGVVCINGVKNCELVRAALKQINAQLSIDELLRYISSVSDKLLVSLSRTLLSHINYAIEEDGDAVKGILRVKRDIDVKLKQKSGFNNQLKSVSDSIYA